MLVSEQILVFLSDTYVDQKIFRNLSETHIDLPQSSYFLVHLERPDRGAVGSVAVAFADLAPFCCLLFGSPALVVRVDLFRVLGVTVAAAGASASRALAYMHLITG